MMLIERAILVSLPRHPRMITAQLIHDLLKRIRFPCHNFPFEAGELI